LIINQEDDLRGVVGARENFFEESRTKRLSLRRFRKITGARLSLVGA